jgi:O-antigen biosynthesis protein
MTDATSPSFSNHAPTAPVAVRLVDLDDDISRIELPPSRAAGGYQSLLCIARIQGEPVGAITLPVASSQSVSAQELDTALRTQLAPQINRLEKSQPVSTPVDSHKTRPGISVVISTCGNEHSVVACVRSLFASVYKPDEVIVVENRPLGSRVENAIKAAVFGDTRLRYIEEPRPGLSQARNAGLQAATQALVAFTDDDVVVDPNWLGRLRSAFAEAPEIACVTGLILPLELETQEQLRFEQFARFGNRFGRRAYCLDQPPADDPLFPYTPGNFGSGGNMAFRTQVLRAVGAYDTALGAGTPARGGEELDLFLRLLWDAATIVHEPAAIVWHRHPEDETQLRRRAYGYGVGLGATLTKCVVRGPGRAGFLRRVPRGIRYLFDPRSAKNRSKGPDFPRSLAWRERLGVLLSPAAYCASVWSKHKHLNLRGSAQARQAWPMTSKQRVISDAAVIALGCGAVGVDAIELPGVIRAIVTLVAALLIPGWAILTKLRVDGMLALFAIAVGLSLAVETLCALLLVWTALWAPGIAAIGLGAVSAAVIAYDAWCHMPIGLSSRRPVGKHPPNIQP